MEAAEEHTERVRMIRDSAGAIAAPDDLKRVRALRYREPGFDRAVWRHMCGLGWVALRVPERMGVFDDPVFRDRYTALRLDLADHKALYETFAEKVRRSEPLGADVSMLKVFQSDLFQRITDTMLEVAGENAGLLDPLDGNRSLHASGLFLQARPTTIYGGSNEIQRGILAKNVLGLPG